MNTSAYYQMADCEQEHWFYLARFRAIEFLLNRYVIPDCQSPHILDVGCGTGGTSVRLARLGTLLGLEPSPLAVRLLRERFPSLQVLQGTVDELPSLVPAASFDLATALGVLCHRGVQVPEAAISNIASRLRTGGWFVWGDCVYPCLARRHDDVVHSARRFYPRQMHEMLERNGFTIIYSSHFLGWGFPIAMGLAALHGLKKAVGLDREIDVSETADSRLPPRILNQVLSGLTFWEWRVGLCGFKAPVGVSRLVLARKAVAAPAARKSECSESNQMASVSSC